MRTAGWARLSLTICLAAASLGAAVSSAHAGASVSLHPGVDAGGQLNITMLGSRTRFHEI